MVVSEHQGSAGVEHPLVSIGVETSIHPFCAAGQRLALIARHPSVPIWPNTSHPVFRSFRPPSHPLFCPLSQVKNKMSLESFRRNLRGVNENTDFPIEFLDDIFYSIVKVGGGL